MALHVLFGSRIVPRAAPCLRAQGAVAVRPLLASALVAPSTSPATAVGLLPGVGLARAYGTRSVWNVRSGRRQLFIWFVVFTAVAGFAQEGLGPYVIFHE